MKITKEQLKQLIEEELANTLDEAWLGPEADEAWQKRSGQYSPHKDPAGFYADVKNRTADPTGTWGPDHDWPEEIQAQNKIASQMYSLLLHTIPQVVKFKTTIDVLRSELASHNTDFSRDALEVLDKQLETVKWTKL